MILSLTITQTCKKLGLVRMNISLIVSVRRSNYPPWHKSFGKNHSFFSRDAFGTLIRIYHDFSRGHEISMLPSAFQLNSFVTFMRIRDSSSLFYLEILRGYKKSPKIHFKRRLFFSQSLRYVANARMVAGILSSGKILSAAPSFIASFVIPNTTHVSSF